MIRFAAAKIELFRRSIFGDSGRDAVGHIDMRRAASYKTIACFELVEAFCWKIPVPVVVPPPAGEGRSENFNGTCVIALCPY